jgi:hypothetical protein
MATHEKTLKLVTNLDRAGIEQRLAAVRNAAQSAGLAEVVGLLNGIEGKPRAQMETQVKGAIKLLATNAEQQGLMAQLELVEINLPNLK